MHVLLLEDSFDGHHAGYLKHIYGAYAERGHRVTIGLNAQCAKHPAAELIREAENSGARVIYFNRLASNRPAMGASALVMRELSIWRAFRAVYRKVHRSAAVDLVVLPYADYCLYAIGLLGTPFGKTAWQGICMRPSFHFAPWKVPARRSQIDDVKAALFLKVLRGRELVQLMSIDELLVDYVHRRHPDAAGRLRYVPDPVEVSASPCTPSEARATFGVPIGAFVILLYGAIDERKGLDQLLGALRAPANRLVHALVVGQQSDWARRTIEEFCAIEGSDRIHQTDRYVTIDMQARAFAAADAVWLGYRAHYAMSSVLVAAAAAGKPVIAANEGLIGWHARKNNLGLVVDVGDPAAVSAAVAMTAAAPSLPLRNPFATHTWQNLLQAVLGDVPESVDLMSWRSL